MTASHASKFRHVESTRLAPVSRGLTHLPVSLPSASSERPALAATSAHFAFVQSEDTHGGSIQVEALSGIDAAEKESQESSETRPLSCAHTRRDA
uniref:Uncharacterized protein n=1 Tax=Peronospora matthiolae TaxID=2874970 RepID=A0AAV1T754_9STRA